MSRRTLVLLAVAGTVATATATLLVLFAHGFEPYRPAEKVAQVATAGVWILAGLVAWQRRPENRVGPVMVVLGFGELAHFFYWDAALPFTIAELVSFFTIPISVYLFLAFPQGFLRTRFQRAFVASTAVAVLVFSPISQLFWDPQGTDCPDCPRNLLLVNDDARVWDIVSRVGDVLLVGILLTTVVLVVRRVRRASAPARRPFGPVLIAAAVSVVLLGVVVVMDAAGAMTEGTVALWLADVAYAAVPIAFLVGLLRMQWHRAAVADLVVRLGRATDPTQLREAIGRALDDPSLVLAFWLPDQQRFVDADGVAVEVGPQCGRAVTMLDHDGRRVAALVHDPTLDDDPDLIAAVGAAASLALENSRLQAELRAQLAEVRGSRARIVAAGDAERRRLERDLHDGAQQRLLGVRLALQLARGRLNGDGHAVDQLLTEADSEVVGALAELRALARGIHPAILTEEGLSAAVHALARRSPVPVEVSCCPGRMPATVEATGYFVAAEALTNLTKHAHATRASIEITRNNGRVAVVVADNGAGGADPSGPGLRGLRDRVEALDGTLRIETAASGGTRITAAIPCA
ncbi:MAG TPA: sensor histidine kinase [Nocardioides sp.]|uniref:sensor histidine kinase n=1 Tax=Nocardioides sp. TaxID=35761 RepID=UPI002E326F7F|nr:sensor histidine kinase [Nocardioides sp.]HEX5088039.1 sensor histidine kinase [Nocardioides sp.]